MDRVYHTWDKWECYPAGFYDPKPPTKAMTIEAAKQAYADFLRDKDRFAAAASRVIVEWRNSSEHYLTNERMNRIAWVGQASMCIETGVSKFFCGGYFFLSEQEQSDADGIALVAINKWMAANGHEPITMQDALGKTQADLY
jgi:hypothetical protein